ncbi:NAD-binding protein [Arthrobacter sp. TMS1-12-1]
MVADIAGKIIYTGALGNGFATKLIHQHVKYATHLAVAEALIIAEKAGLDAATTIDALESSTGVAGGQKSAVEYFTGNKRAMRSHAPNKTIAKDMRQAAALAESLNVTSTTLAAAHEFFAAAADGENATQPYPESTALLVQLRTGERDIKA